MSTIEEINQELIKIWSNQDYSRLVPMIYPELHKNSFLWVGINPSYSPKDIKSVLLKGKEMAYEYLINSDKALEEFFTHKHNLSEIELKNHQEIQKLHHMYHPFFGARIKVYEEVKSKFPKDVANEMPEIEHIDLFHVRVTDSKQLYKDTGLKDNFIFFQNQILLFKKILDYINPKVILIANAKLSNYLLGNYSPIKFTEQPIEIQKLENYNYNHGVYSKAKIGKTYINGREVSVLFFKQLTQGGTKIIEREDLINQIYQVFNKS